MSGAEAREALKRAAKAQGESLSGLSLFIGRNRAYLHHHVERGSPKELNPKDRQKLASYLGIEETLLGASAEFEPQQPGAVRVPRLAVQASAGLGRLVDSEEQIGWNWFDRAGLRRLCRGKPGDLATITVRGDSMATTLQDGDEVLVDRSDAATGLRDGIYVLRRDDTLMVKRVALGPVSGRIDILSDNPSYPSWRDCPLDGVDVLARVVWFARELR